MLTSILSSIICSEFSKQFPEKFAKDRECLSLDFDIYSNFGVEHGYRHLDLVIYAPTNYVAVFVRERWNVAPATEGELTGDYVEGDTGWKIASYHDSCWRDAVNRIIFENRERLSHIAYVFRGGWCERKALPEELTDELVREMCREHQPRYVTEEGVFQFERKK